MSTSLQMQNPEPFLQQLHGKMIGVQLKWGWELQGILQSKDEYMNLLQMLVNLLMEKRKVTQEKYQFDAIIYCTQGKQLSDWHIFKMDFTHNFLIKATLWNLRELSYFITGVIDC